MKNYEKLEKRINTLLREYRQHKKSRDQLSKTDALQARQEELKSFEAFDNINALYAQIMSYIPEEKKAETQAALEAKFFQIAPEMFPSIKSGAANSRRLKTPEQRKYFLLHLCTQRMIDDDIIWDLLNVAAENIDNAQLDEAIEASKNYRSPRVHNLPVQYLKDKVEEMKKRNEDIFPEGNLVLKSLNEELDTVAKTVITSSFEYGDENGNEFEKIYDHNNIQRLEQSNTELIKQEKYKKYTQYLDMMVPDAIFGIPNVRKEQVGNPAVAEEFFNEQDVPFVISDKVANGLSKIIGFMHEKGMTVDNGNLGEEAVKAYGFKQILEAHNNLEKAIQSMNPILVKEAREQYEESLQNMREVYKMIEEELNPTEDMMVGNVSSYRETWVPGEFKNNLIFNSYANAIYNLAMNLAASNCSLDEFCKNPKKNFLKMMRGFAAQATPNKRFEESGFIQGMVYGVQKKVAPTSPYPYGAVSRSVEFLVQLSLGTPEFANNGFAGMLMQSYDSFLFSLSADHSKYMEQNMTETLANMMIVREEDRDFDKLRAHEATKQDGIGKIPAFDTIGYLDSHKMEPEELAKRIKDTINGVLELNKRDDDDQSLSKASPDDLVKIIQGAQMAAYQYMMVVPEPFENPQKGYEELKQILENPQKAFPKAMTKKVLEGLRKAKEAGKSVKIPADKAQSTLEQARTEAREAEAAYAEKIKDVTNPEKLQELRQQEIARLEQAYADGKLPNDYFEQRRVDVEFGRHTNTVPFGVSERPTMKQFKELHKAEFKDMSSKEIKYLYNSMMDNAKREENKFLLVAAGTNPKPKLDVQAPELDSAEKQNQKVSISISKSELGEQTEIKQPEIKQRDKTNEKLL